MTMKSIQNFRERLDSLKVNYEGVYRFPEAELKVKNGSTVVTVTCAIHGNFDLSLVDAHDTCLCKKCEQFFYYLVSTSDKQKAFETMREIYTFAFDNRRLVDRFRKVTKNHNNMHKFYDMFKEAKKAKEEAEPVVVHQTVNTVNDDSVLQRKYRTYQDALADLNTLYDNTLVFPKIQEEYEFIRSDITTICPIHGETISSFVKMYWTKSACRKCLPLRRKLKIVYGREVVFEKMLEQYRKAKDNPDYVEPSLDQLLLESNKTSRDVAVSFRSYKDKAFLGNKEAYEKLIELYGDAYEFPNVNKEFIGPTSNITGVCIIHGEFNKPFHTLISSKSGCPECKRFRVEIVNVLKTKGNQINYHQSFDYIVALYRYLKKSKEQLDSEAYSNLLLLIDMYHGVLPDIIEGFAIISDLPKEIDADQPDTNTGVITAITEQHGDSASDEMLLTDYLSDTNWLQDILPVNFELPKPAVVLEQFVKSTLRQPTPTADERSEVIPSNRKRVDDIVAFFNNLNLNDIVKLHADIDLETDEEALVLSLKSGQTIKVC